MFNLTQITINWVSKNADDSYDSTIDELVDYGIPHDNYRDEPMVIESVTVPGYSYLLDPVDVHVHYDDGFSHTLDLLAAEGMDEEKDILGITVEE